MTGTGVGAAKEKNAPVRSIRVLGPGAWRNAKFSTNSAEIICTESIYLFGDDLTLLLRRVEFAANDDFRGRIEEDTEKVRCQFCR